VRGESGKRSAAIVSRSSFAICVEIGVGQVGGHDIGSCGWRAALSHAFHPKRYSGADGTGARFADAGRRGYIRGMAEAFFVRVEAPRSVSLGHRTFEIWIVATDDPAVAVSAVKAKVAPGANVELIHDRPADETIKRLALAPGQAWLL
jgi:hypothetical protein